MAKLSNKNSLDNIYRPLEDVLKEKAEKEACKKCGYLINGVCEWQKIKKYLEEINNAKTKN